MTRDERQEIVVQNFFKAKGRGIFLGSVGFGKSRVAINIIKKLKEKKDVHYYDRVKSVKSEMTIPR